MRPLKVFLISVASVLLVISACTLAKAAQAAQAATVGTVTYTEGRVDILPSGSEKWVGAVSGSSVAAGDAIRTKSSSRAEVAFNDKTIMRIAQNSRVNVKEYQLGANGSRQSANIMIERGKARTIIAKMKDAAEFKLCTPNSCGTVKGSDIFTFYQAGNSGIFVAEGALTVFNPALPEAVVSVPSGSAALVPLDGVPKGPRKYLEMEEKSHAEDTDIPETLSTRKGASVIRGAIAKFTGDVRVTPKGSGEAHSAKQGETVNEGDKIETGPNSIVEIALDNGNALYLKPDTEIVILKLVIDAKTGEFENLFGMDKGDVKARIEGLKGKSKFEVKTPTAICGARGTIMLVHVAAGGATSSFFEGGNGYTTNLMSGQTMDVGAGGGASTDAGGSVTGTGPLSGDERAGMDDGFDPDNGTGGSDEGSGEGDLDGTGIGGTTSQVEDASRTADAGTGDTIDAGDVVDVPITVADGSILTDDPAEDVQHVIQVGDFFYTVLDADNEPKLADQDGGMYDFGMTSYGSYGYDPADENDFYALWRYPDTGEYASFDISGNFDLAGNTRQYLIWTTDNLYSWSEQAQTYTTYDGGAFYCVMGGTIDTGAEGAIRALAVGLYLNADGNAGVFFGEGIADTAESFTLDGTGSFWAGRRFAPYDDNTLETTVYLTKPDGERLLPEDLHEYIESNGSLSGEGYADLGSEGSSEAALKLVDGFRANIDSELSRDWGIWAARFAGSYKNVSEEGWEMALSGTSEIDSVTDGVFTQHLCIDTWSPAEVYGTSEGAYLSLRDDGTIKGGASTNGRILGNYIDVDCGQTGTWQAVGCGEWVEVFDNTMIVDIDMITSQLSNLSESGYLSVPITVAASIDGLSGIGAFNGNAGALNITAMDMRLYESVLGANNGIWAAEIVGNFTGAGSNVWSVIVNGVDSTSSVTLTGTQWADNKWRADVSGAVVGEDSVSRTVTGIATGVYQARETVDGIDSGILKGSGVGTWVNTGNSDATVTES